MTEVIIGILIVLVYLLVNLYLASLMNEVAKSKGHENSKAFVLVLLLGGIGILYVIALPDLHERQQREDILSVLLKIQQEDK